MARIRNLKIGFFHNEHLAELPALDRLLFAGLWCIADREGRLEDRPRRIGAELFPYEQGFDVNAALQRLHDARFIVRYTHGDLRLIQIPKFLRHQHPHLRENASVFPKPSASTGPAPFSPGELDLDLELDLGREDLAENVDPALVNRRSHADVTRARESDLRQDSDGRTLKDGVAWKANGVNGHHKPTNLIDGADQRRHGSHAWCGRVCVHRSLHDDLKRKGGKTDDDLRAWYPTVLEKYEGKAIGDDEFNFWRNEFGAWVGVVTQRPTQKKSGGYEAFKKQVENNPVLKKRIDEAEKRRESRAAALRRR